MANVRRKTPPATTMEGRESQMASLALELAEERLRNRTATAQEIVYFAKQGTINTLLEREILEKNKELITAKTDAIRSEKKMEELYSEAISAMKTYAGETDRSEYED